uniref:Uncharacterized protein n=1 Tax=Rhizophora mucronata TaxID=61149 RepID=A0A2P2KWN9_RHIMU
MAGSMQTLMLTISSSRLPLSRHQWRLLDLPAGYSTRSVSFTGGCCCRPSMFSRIRIRASGQPRQVDGNGNEAAKPSGLPNSFNWLLNFTGANFLPLALVGGVLLGLANPSLGCLADRCYLSKFSTFAIFIISGLTLRNGDISAAVEAWPVGVFGLV